jgi:hypothetical protein
MHAKMAFKNFARRFIPLRDTPRASLHAGFATNADFLPYIHDSVLFSSCHSTGWTSFNTESILTVKTVHVNKKDPRNPVYLLRTNGDNIAKSCSGRNVILYFAMNNAGKATDTFKLVLSDDIFAHPLSSFKLF